jgi:rSAM/selenodomain-associated transferase 1
MRRGTLIVMLKEPRAGRVKTRLGKDIGMTAAAWWFRHQVKRLLRRIEDPRWNVVLAVAPDRAGLLSRVWPSHLPRIPQGHGDLGDRMARAMQSIPIGPVCVIGADIPGVGPKQIARAFAALGASDAVFGPAPDGGYWLIGLRKTHPLPPTIFQDVRWSTEHALADSRASLGGLSVAWIDELQDVDTIDDLTMTSPQ